MRPKNKKHIFITHRQQKIPRTKPQKRKNKQQQQNKHYSLLFFYRIRVHYTVLTQHTTPQTTPNHTRPKTNGPQPAKGPAYLRGDSIEQQSVLPQTPNSMPQNKTNHQNPNTLAALQNPPTNKAEKASPCFINSKNPTHNNACAVLAFT